MLDIRAAHDVLRGFDEGITELEQKKQETAPADAARLRELQHEIEQLETARYMLSSIARSRAVSVITEFLTKRGLDFRQMDPEIVTFFRELLLQAIKAHVKRREYYKAHYYLWDLLRPDRETPVQWTDAQLRELSELKGQVEEKLRKALGPDIPLPDWKRFSDKMPKRKRE
jgi:antitoxin component HigA of HigAB toxin-antitoxin module